jgi:O-antigen/teichoic acid export membrane protein
MSQVQRIFKNMSWLLLSQIIASVSGFIWTIIIAQYLGVDDYGVLGFAISFTGILTALNDLGVGTHIIRHVATDFDSANKYLGNAISLKSLFSTFNFGISLIILIIMKCNPITIQITLLFTIESILKSFFTLFSSTFQAFEEGKYQAIGNIIMNLLLLLFVFIVIFTDTGIFGITFAYLLSNIIALIYIGVALQKNITKINIQFDKEFCKKITIASIPFAISGLLHTLYYSIDMIMLTPMSGDYATGIYNATYRLISVLTLFYGVYGAVIFPVMSRMFKNDKELLNVSFEKSVKYLMLIIIPIAVATQFYSLDIVILFFGKEYSAASTPLSILIWTICLIFFNGSVATALNASFKEIAVAKLNFIAVIFNVVLNLFMIPKYSYNGAAVTTVLTDLLLLFLYVYVMKQINLSPNKKFYLDIGKIITGSVILGIALYFLKLNMWIAIPIGIIIYFVAIFILRVFDDDDKYIVKEILGRN